MLYCGKMFIEMLLFVVGKTTRILILNLFPIKTNNDFYVVKEA